MMQGSSVPSLEQLALDLQLLEHGFHAYQTVCVWCSIDGLIRVDLSRQLDIDGVWPCPVCKVDRPTSGTLAVGYTKRHLPSWVRIIAAINWDAITEDYEPRRCVHCGETYTPVAINQLVCGDRCRDARSRRARGLRAAVAATVG